MSKALIKIQKSDMPTFKKVSEFSELKFDEKENVAEYGTVSAIEVNVKNVNQLFEAGQMFEQLRATAKTEVAKK